MGDNGGGVYTMEFESATTCLFGVLLYSIKQGEMGRCVESLCMTATWLEDSSCTEEVIRLTFHELQINKLDGTKITYNPTVSTVYSHTHIYTYYIHAPLHTHSTCTHHRLCTPHIHTQLTHITHTTSTHNTHYITYLMHRTCWYKHVYKNLLLWKNNMSNRWFSHSFENVHITDNKRSRITLLWHALGMCNWNQHLSKIPWCDLSASLSHNCTRHSCSQSHWNI